MNNQSLILILSQTMPLKSILDRLNRSLEELRENQENEELKYKVIVDMSSLSYKLLYNNMEEITEVSKDFEDFEKFKEMEKEIKETLGSEE